MNSSINVDHLQLSEFSGYLLRFGADGFDQVKAEIERALSNIQGNGWSDNKFLEFQSEFNQSKAYMEQIIELMRYYSSYLATKAAKVEAYQNFKNF